MKDVGNYLVSEVKNMEGKIITIGLDIDKVFTAIEKNTNIVECMTLNSTLYETSDIRRLIRRNKTLSASKLRKKFKKKKQPQLIRLLLCIDKLKLFFLLCKFYYKQGANCKHDADGKKDKCIWNKCGKYISNK